jgi:peptidyl-prolyl cis-trans isomerase A (cyclophilin A)
MAGSGGRKEVEQMRGDELYATLETSLGTIRIRLFAREAPKTVENFVGLARGTKEWTDPRTGEKVRRPLYDGTIFHRVVPEFMIQGGDPLGRGTGGPGYKFDDEFSGRKFDKPGLVAMANTGPNSNGSQFFITEVPAPWLNNRHTIFGEVVEGMEVVRTIARVRRGAQDRPEQDVVLERVIISESRP